MRLDKIVSSGYFYVVGDNPEKSFDSRYWGLLLRDRIILQLDFKLHNSSASPHNLLPFEIFLFVALSAFVALNVILGRFFWKVIRRRF